MIDVFHVYIQFFFVWGNKNGSLSRFTVFLVWRNKNGSLSCFMSKSGLWIGLEKETG